MRANFGVSRIEGTLSGTVWGFGGPDNRGKSYKIADTHYFWPIKMSISWFDLKQGFGNLDYSGILPRLVLNSTYTVILPNFCSNAVIKVKNDFRQIFIFNL